ncbi:hypothetical protein KAS41_00915 [Candidatus Parcubacteria bacterium]|nr:hypothetical protein [Candidatus Parcubacteria bacterium]
MIFPIITTVLKDEVKDFKNKNGEKIEYRKIKVFNPNEDEDVTEISVAKDFPEIPMKEMIQLEIESVKGLQGYKFKLLRIINQK